jgi:hypothetical protein
MLIWLVLYSLGYFSYNLTSKVIKTMLVKRDSQSMCALLKCSGEYQVLRG